MDGVRAVREKHEASMVDYICAYYEAKGEREPTRQALIPPTFDAHKERLESALSSLIQRSEEDRQVAIKALRLQLLGLERQTLHRLGPAVLDDVAANCRAAVLLATSRLETAHRPLATDFVKKRHLHQQSLKPSLRNPSCQAELLALDQAEASRCTAALQAGGERREALLREETDMAQAVLRRLVHLPQLLLQLLDATVFESDLVPADEPPEDLHYALKKKMRIDQHEAKLSLSEDAAAEGRPFSVHVWPGLPVNELTPAAAGIDAAAAGGEGGEGEAPATSAEASSNNVRAHRAVIGARDRVYVAYKGYYVARMAEIARMCDAALSEEQQWKVIWDKLVASSKVGGVA